ALLRPAFLRRGRRRGRAAGRPAAAAVGPVEAGPLEHDAHGRKDLAQPAAAVLMHGKRLVGELLHRLELTAAFGANVLVSGHDSSQAEQIRFATLALAVADC